MIISLLLTIATDILGLFAYIFPTWDLTTAYQNNVQPLIQYISNAMSPFAYFFALDHLILALSPVLLYSGYRLIINQVTTFKTLVKWW
jgi:hypothetical protein